MSLPHEDFSFLYVAFFLAYLKVSPIAALTSFSVLCGNPMSKPSKNKWYITN